MKLKILIHRLNSIKRYNCFNRSKLLFDKIKGLGVYIVS